MSLRDKMLPNMKYSNAAENFEIASAEKKQKGSATKRTQLGTERRRGGGHYNLIKFL